MDRLVFFSALFTIFVRISGEIFFSHFTNSEVIEELSNCVDGTFNGFLSKRDATTELGCSSLCSITDHCRRFMYRRTTGLCLLYHSGENCLVQHKHGDEICYRLKSLCERNMEKCTRCPFGYYGNKCENIIQDCSEGTDKLDVPHNYLLSYIRPIPDGKILEVKCEFNTEGLTVIQHRDADCKAVDFNRPWNEYKNGFGNAYGEYWLGLTHLHAILQNRQFKLTLLLDDRLRRWNNPKIWHYNFFNISGEGEDYAIAIDDVRGSGDMFSWWKNNIYRGNINGRPFSTIDSDNGGNNCPEKFQGGWWYIDDSNCGIININGERSYGNTSSTDANIHWWYDNQKIYDMRCVQLKIEKN